MGNKGHKLNARQRKFVALVVRYGNQTKAYKEAGYNAKNPSLEAYRLARLPLVAAAIRETLDAEIGGKEGLESILRRHSACNLADFEPWLRGEKTLAELQEAGVDTGLVKSCTITPNQFGESRRLELVDCQSAVALLAKLGGHVVDRRDVTSRGALETDLAGATAEELQRLAHAAGDAPGGQA